MTSLVRFIMDSSLMNARKTSGISSQLYNNKTTTYYCYSHSYNSTRSLLKGKFSTQKSCFSSLHSESKSKQIFALPFTPLLPSKITYEENRNRKFEIRILENQERKMKKLITTILVIVAMLVVQVVFAGSQILTNLALKKQGFLLALLTYRHLIAAACIAPIAVIFDRKQMSELKKIRVWFWAFLTALSGITMGMGLFYYGVRDTSAAYATNYSNLIPIITFLFSVIIRMEKLEVSTVWGKAKGLGVIICVGGALVISLYNGPSFNISSHNSSLSKHVLQKPYDNLLRGTLLLIASCFGYAFWFVVQAKLLKVLPSKHWSTFLTCLVAAAQCAVLGLCLDRTSRSWSLGWDVKLLCVTFSGIFASALAFYLILWSVELKDPSYPSMFDPFSVVFVAVIQGFFFGDQLTLGLLLGMILMIVGLYCYLWGKRREDLSTDKVLPSLSPTRRTTDKVLPSLSPTRGTTYPNNHSCDKLATP